MVHKNGGSVVFHFKGDTSQLDKSLSGLTSKIAIGNLIAKGVGKAFQIIDNSMDGAIKRVDTFNQFPKVMENFGVSSKEASKSIERIDKATRGLPIALDQSVAGVQNLFMVTKDLKQAEGIFKAITDSAMVFAGGSTEAIDRFSYAFKQAMSSGKVSAQDFNQMNEAIPGLMDKVAQSMGMTYAQLKKGLSDGSISMDQFNKALTDLDTKGGAGMQSLEKSAKASTGGIATNITNMKTAIVRGIGNAIDTINNSLQKSNLPSIPEMIQIISDKISKGFKQVNKVISKIDWQKVIKAIKILIPIVATLLAGLMAYKVVVGILNAVAVAQALLNAVMLLNPVGLMVAGVVMLIAILVMLYKKCTWFRNMVNTMIKYIVAGVKTFVSLFKAYINIIITIVKGLINGFKAVINFVKNNWKMLLGFLVNPIGTAFVLLYKKCGWFRNIVNGFVKGVKNAFLTMVNFIKSIPGKIKSVFTGMANIGKNMIKGLWNGAKSMKDWVIDKIKGLGKSILNGMKKVLGIKSPSKEFAIIGKFSILGYTEELEKMKPELDKAINGMFNLSPSMTGTMNNTLSPNVNVVNNVNVETDPLGQVVSKIKTFSGGAKNDYNYGYGG